MYEPGISGYLMGYRSSVEVDPSRWLSTQNGRRNETPESAASFDSAVMHADAYNKRWPGRW